MYIRKYEEIYSKKVCKKNTLEGRQTEMKEVNGKGGTEKKGDGEEKAGIIGQK